ncbi:MAG: protein-L-isoaspartate(D-aspartate) O-methyltransferase [Planctomycetaceae bacterium]|nr:MAG: protein-L-isoaspartate(D-aspartate) O-methyltransferase [Planctomycetaceae bacterium]
MSTHSNINRIRERERLVAQIEREGIRSPAVLDALRQVPREAFVPAELHEAAYYDSALPIGHEQTISQPFVVALMAATLELKSTDRVLEIGTGSGYAAAVLAAIAKEVYTVERHRELAETARERLRTLGFANVHVLHADGTRGWPEHAPYQAITVAAGGPDVPQPLRDQLAIGGRLVIPVGRKPSQQQLIRVRKIAEDDYRQENLGEVRFVPLVGAAGWDGEERVR